MSVCIHNILLVVIIIIIIFCKNKKRWKETFWYSSLVRDRKTEYGICLSYIPNLLMLFVFTWHTDKTEKVLCKKCKPYSVTQTHRSLKKGTPLYHRQFSSLLQLSWVSQIEFWWKWSLKKVNCAFRIIKESPTTTDIIYQTKRERDKDEKIVWWSWSFYSLVFIFFPC